MFSAHYPSFDASVRRVLAQINSPSTDLVADLLEKSLLEPLALSEAAQLLAFGQRRENGLFLRQHLRSRYFRAPRRVLRHIAPIYLSSYCADACGYCQFSAVRKNVERTRLSLEEYERELNTVLSFGNRVIELVLATDLEIPPERLTPYLSLTKEKVHGKGGGVLLSSTYMSDEAYKDLKEAGLDGMVQWDETLDREAYRRWHRGSYTKQNFFERIDNHDRAMRAELDVATGCLFGLADCGYDLLMQICKVRYLFEEYGRWPFAMGIPRLKPIGDRAVIPLTHVNDGMFETAITVLKLALPDVPRWFQTRESPQINFRNLVPGDTYTYRCGEVKPGGYAVRARSLPEGVSGQFSVHEMGREEFESLARRTNFSIDYAWM